MVLFIKYEMAEGTGFEPVQPFIVDLRLAIGSITTLAAFHY